MGITEEIGRDWSKVKNLNGQVKCYSMKGQGGGGTPGPHGREEGHEEHEKNVSRASEKKLHLKRCWRGPIPDGGKREKKLAPPV